MGAVLSFVTGFVAPVFIIVSPITSYADQIAAIYRSKSSAGFSLDIPLIMLLASILRVFYYPGAQYDMSLLIQATIMIIVQVILLHVALENRPSPSSKGGEASQPFAGIKDGEFGNARPYNFWQWRSPKPYWQFLLYLLITLMACELIFAPFGFAYDFYSSTIGYLGLAIEATLPIPQILANNRMRSCKGFRFSVLVSWIAGDAMKMLWFFTATTEIPWAFKFCGMFQACCDSFLGVQYFMYGAGESVPSHAHSGISIRQNGGARSPRAIHIPMLEKDDRLD
ncbi:hypothetical protein V502_06290 [Pseudogymnoascus sp. VKM F-4520 (FW-2644)]|nr:hypothetical protein V502_06290 [Pseudogymnoascus sp. VKM F-4520 (FW-2644)]